VGSEEDHIYYRLLSCGLQSICGTYIHVSCRWQFMTRPTHWQEAASFQQHRWDVDFRRVTLPIPSASSTVSNDSSPRKHEGDIDVSRK
jgi:hypothetical protein